MNFTRKIASAAAFVAGLLLMGANTHAAPFTPPVVMLNTPFWFIEGQDWILDATGSYDPDSGDSLTFEWLVTEGYPPTTSIQHWTSVVTTPDFITVVPAATADSLGLPLDVNHTIALRATDTTGLTTGRAASMAILSNPNEVSAVPLPAALPLMAGGLGLLWLMGARTRRRNPA